MTYIASVCQHIRWKKSHVFISKELENHIIDQKNAFVSEGLDEYIALEKAIIEMGNPTDVGEKLDRIHKPKMEWSIVLFTSIALLLGLAIRIVTLNGTPMEYMIGKSIFYSMLGIGVMMMAYYLDYTMIGRYPKTLFSLFLVVFIGISIVSPLSLPLISYGGVGTILNMFLIGIMLSVFKWDNLINEPMLLSGKKFFNYIDGKIIIDFKSLNL